MKESSGLPGLDLLKSLEGYRVNVKQQISCDRFFISSKALLPQLKDVGFKFKKKDMLED